MKYIALISLQVILYHLNVYITYIYRDHAHPQATQCFLLCQTARVEYICRCEQCGLPCANGMRSACKLSCL